MLVAIMPKVASVSHMMIMLYTFISSPIASNKAGFLKYVKTGPKCKRYHSKSIRVLDFCIYRFC